MASQTPPMEETPIRVLEQSFEDYIDSDPTLACIFGDAIVCVETRNDPQSRRNINPVKYCDDLRKKMEQYRAEFDSAKVREDFLRDAAAGTSELHSLQIAVKEKKQIDLVSDIPDQDVKSWKEIEFMGQTIDVPMINNEKLEHYDRLFSHLIPMLLENLKANAAIRFRTLDSDKTMQGLKTIARRLTGGFATNQIRKELTINIVTALLMDTLYRSDTNATARFLVERTVHDDELEGGMFIRLDKHFTEQRDTLIRADSVGVELKVVYNLTLPQLHSLITVLFSLDPKQVMEHKIKILSSTKGDTRNDIALNPELVLLHAIREHYLTRTDILYLFFGQEDSATRRTILKCPCCGTSVRQLSDTSVCHTTCSIVTWLVDKFQFEVTDDVVTIPAFGYVKPGIAHYARQVYKTISENQHKPFIGKNKDEFVVYKLDDHGKASKLAHQGSKPVRLDQPMMHPTTSSRR